MIDGEPGDLKFVVRQLPNERWERRGNDLLINETISLVDALTGWCVRMYMPCVWAYVCARACVWGWARASGMRVCVGGRCGDDLRINETISLAGALTGRCRVLGVCGRAGGYTHTVTVSICVTVTNTGSHTPSSTWTVMGSHFLIRHALSSLTLTHM